MSAPEIVLVPVRRCALGTVRPVVCRSGGERTGIAFSSAERLRAALGPDVCSLSLGMHALHEMLADSGVAVVRVDPDAVVSGVRSATARQPDERDARARSGRRSR